MAVVTVYSTAKIDEFINAGVVGAAFVSGNLVLTLGDGSTVDLGPVISAVANSSETVKGVVELATDVETQTGTDATRAVTPFGLASRVASDTAKGMVELATSAEVLTGTDATRAVTPAGVGGRLYSVQLHNGSAYVDTASTKVYIGPTDPGSVPNGSIWFDTTGI